MYSLNLYFIITIIVCRFWGFVLGGNAVLHNNGYENITVAIGKDVPEDHTIIDNIKQMFEDASSVLYEAKGVYFSGVTIVVPSTWSNDNGYDLLPSRRPLNADIRVDLPHPVHGDSPYTLQPGGCGAPGIYTHLSPTYAANMFHLQETYGPPAGKVLAQQWAHLRWGVFDEYGGHGTPFPSFYVERDFKLHATGCTYDILGWMRKKDGEQCHADTEGLPDEECHFFPAQDNTISASLMNFNINSLRSVNKFCDEETHNPDAPTAHNLHCKGKSVGEVIAQHEDFKDMKMLPRSKHVSFQLFHEAAVEKPRFILWMSKDMCFGEFYQDVVSFVRDSVPVGSQMAVMFSSTNTFQLALNFTQVSDQNRENIINDLFGNSNSDGHKNIEDAPEFMMELLEGNEMKSDGSRIILITNGEDEARASWDADIHQVIKGKNIIIDAISYGPEVADSLKNWVKDTRGKSLYYTKGSRNMDHLLFQLISTDRDDGSEQLLQVQRVLLQVKPFSTTSESAFLDSSLGRQTHFVFSEVITTDDSNNLSVKVKLISPDETIYDENSADIYQEHSKTRTIKFKIMDAQNGTWRYNIISEGAQPVNEVLVEVTSFFSSDAKDKPIRAKTWLSTEDVAYPSPIIVYTSVSQGYNAILYANVTAIIERPTNDTVRIPLFDNGIGADLVRGDGIYSNYFTQFSGNGPYSISALISTTTTTARIQGLSPSESEGGSVRVSNTLDPKGLPPAALAFRPDTLESPTHSGERRSIRSFQEVSVEPFTRFTYGGMFKVKQYNAKDKQPPGRVTDLEVTPVAPSDVTAHSGVSVSLTFTSPGDDFYDGTALVYELRYHRESITPENFYSGHKVNSTNLTPIPAGNKHTLTLKITEFSYEDLEERVLFFALKAIDEEQNAGSLSNIAVVFFKHRDTRNKALEEKAMRLTTLAVMVVIGGIAILLATFVCVVKGIHARNQQMRHIPQRISQEVPLAEMD